jgi:hypothetical protein
MITLQVHTDGGQRRYRPGETVAGTASWYFDEGVKALELRLFWHTRGRGTQDVAVVQSTAFDAPQPQESRAFAFALPESPYSFEGRLLTIAWALELVALPSGEAYKLDLAVSPTGEPVRPGGEHTLDA